MKKKVMVFLPAGKVNVTVQSKALKTNEIDNTDNDYILVNLHYE